MKFDIFKRWSGEVQFSAEITYDENTSMAAKVGLAVKWALTNGASLDGASLDGARLVNASLDGASLVNASLGGASLGGASLVNASLDGARLDGASLDGARLDGASLVNASLDGARLDGARLDGARLDGARLDGIRADFLAEVLNMPNELDSLRDTIIAGKIDGSTYSGECCCLAGTLAKSRGIGNYNGETIKNGRDFHANASSLRERFFTAIKKGDTPETNPASKIVLQWTEEAISMRDYIRSSSSTSCANDHS